MHLASTTTDSNHFCVNRSNNDRGSIRSTMPIQALEVEAASDSNCRDGLCNHDDQLSMSSLERSTTKGGATSVSSTNPRTAITDLSKGISALTGMGVDLEAARKIRLLEKEMFEDNTSFDQEDLESDTDYGGSYHPDNDEASPNNNNRHEFPVPPLPGEIRQEGPLLLPHYQGDGDDILQTIRSSEAESNKTSMLVRQLSPQTRAEILNLLIAIDEKEHHQEGEVCIEEETAEEWRSARFDESAFTLLYMCGLRSQGFWYGLFVFALQITTIVLTLVDSLEDGRNGNALAIPAMVDLTVTIAQAVALFLAMACQSDLIEALLKLNDGFLQDEVLQQLPGASYSNWLFSCLSQLLLGLLLLTTIFVLTIQADSVLGIVLSFAAMHILAKIDEVGFCVARLGFINTKLQQQVMEVITRSKLATNNHYHRYYKRRGNLLPRILYILFLLGIFNGYGFLKQAQLNGEFLPSYLYIQFGDIPFSYRGLFRSGGGGNTTTTTTTTTTKMTSGYTSYTDVDNGNIHLAYCKSKRYWTFSFNNNNSNNPCQDFFAKSKETNTYDVTTISNADWVVVLEDTLSSSSSSSSSSQLQPFDSFILVGKDCSPEICQGECFDKLCRCSHDRFGFDCEFGQGF